MAKGVYIGVHREAENNNYINATVLTPSNIANYASVSNRT